MFSLSHIVYLQVETSESSIDKFLCTPFLLSDYSPLIWMSEFLCILLFTSILHSQMGGCLHEKIVQVCDHGGELEGT